MNVIARSIRILSKRQNGFNLVKRRLSSLSLDRPIIYEEYLAHDNSFEVINPANGKVIANVPDLGKEETDLAIDQAYEAFQTWRLTTAKERSNLLRKWFELCIKHQDDLAKILTAEQGKPLAEARGEILYGSGFLEWFLF